jgi:hypothetical protein
VPPAGNLLLPVKRQVVAVFGGEDRGEKSGTRLAALQHRRQLRDDRGAMRLVAPDIAASHDPAAHVARRFVVELLGDLFVDLPPRSGFGAHFLRIEDDFHRGQRVEERLGDASFGFALTRWLRRAGRVSLQGADGVAGGFGLFCLFALQGEQQLPGVELFAARAEDPPHEQVDLFPQQLDLLRLARVFPAQGLVLFGEAGFQWRHFGHRGGGLLNHIFRDCASDRTRDDQLSR